MLMFQFQFSIIIIIMDELKVWITGKKKQNKKKSSTFWQREKQWKYEWRTNESIIGYFFFYCLSNGCTWNGDILFHSLHYTSFTLLFFLVCFVFVATKKKNKQSMVDDDDYDPQSILEQWRQQHRHHYQVIFTL